MPLLGPPLHVLLRVGVVVPLARVLLDLDAPRGGEELLLTKMRAGDHNEAAVVGATLRAGDESLGELKLESGTSTRVDLVSKTN